MLFHSINGPSMKYEWYFKFTLDYEAWEYNKRDYIDAQGTVHLFYSP